jgi:MFS family permease
MRSRVEKYQRGRPTVAAEGGSIGRLLAIPRVRAVAVASALARMPFAMGGVALVIFVHSRTGSFSDSGAVTAAFTLSFAVAGPVLGRLVDRRGPRSVLLPGATLSALGVLATVALGEGRAPLVALVFAAAVAGAAMPPISGVLRRAWPSMVEPEELPSAFLLDSILIETIFIAGQLLTGVLAVAIDPAAPLVFAAAAGLGGTAWFVARPEIAAIPPSPHGRGSRIGALASPAIRLLVVTGIPIGFTFGALDVALPAFGAGHGSAAIGGLLTAMLGVGSVLGGVVYGIYGTRLGDLRQACLRLAAVQPLLSLLLLLAPSPLAMVPPAILAGTYTAPIITVRSRMAQIAMPPGTGTETFTWILLAVMVGVSAGSLAAGPLVEAAGWRAGVGIAAALPLAALPILIAAREHLPRG